MLSFALQYFKPGIENIRLNNGESTVTDDHVSAVCRQILEEAKKMYGDAGLTAASEVKTEVDRSRSPSHSLRENQDVRAKKVGYYYYFFFLFFFFIVFFPCFFSQIHYNE